MRRFYIFVSRDILNTSGKRVMTYRCLEEPNWVGGLIGRRPKSSVVKFIGRDYVWETYPEGRECTTEEMEMLRNDDEWYGAMEGENNNTMLF